MCQLILTISQRYNTLDFPTENRVPTGMLLAPIGNPEPRDFTPLDTPYIFLENSTQTAKMQFDTISQKYKTATTSILHGNENCNGFIYYQSISCLMICSNNEFVKNRLLVSGGNAPSVPQGTSFYGVYNDLLLSSKLFGIKENISNRAKKSSMQK